MVGVKGEAPCWFRLAPLRRGCRVGAGLGTGTCMVHLCPGCVINGAQFLDCAREIVYGPFVVVPEVLEIRFDLLYKLIVGLNGTVGMDLVECLHYG